MLKKYLEHVHTIYIDPALWRRVVGQAKERKQSASEYISNALIKSLTICWFCGNTRENKK